MNVGEKALVRSICQDSFYCFLQEFWDIIVPEDPVWNWHIPYLCNELQRLAERVFKGQPKKHDLIINVPPGSTKSTICSVAFPAWTWTRDPSMRSICASFAYDLALDLSRKSRDIVQSEKYMACFPEVKIRQDQNTKGHFATTKGGMRYAVGTGGNVTGRHAHFLIVDDPLDPQAAVSELELKAANDWMSHTLPTRKVDKKITPTILIMQRLHQDDPTGHTLEKKKANVRHVCLPGKLNKHVSPKVLRRQYAKQNGYLDPVRMPDAVLEEVRTDLGEFGYAGQIEQHPVPLSGGMFEIDKLTIGEPPHPREFVRFARYWDKAGSLDKRAAWTAGVLMGLDKRDRLWVLDVQRFRKGSADREAHILQRAKLDEQQWRETPKHPFNPGRVPVGVEQEPGSGGLESAEGTVRNLMGYVVVVHRPTGDKVRRADPFSVQVNRRNVFLAKAPWNATYVDEMEYFPDSTYKDQIDASSGAFQMVVRPGLQATAS